ncbi:hypothetical protein FACS1894160_4480 [Bacteroidia bacterium]|nr:hypothetical protein FACS1894123_05270 [Bacteroidia bacterium]GHV09118.1 hypothetical protein FACS1894160_4480 [Bacteroidia bacterium]
MAQEKEFEDFLSHCIKIELPFRMTDAEKIFYPALAKEGSEIPVDVIRKFICTPALPCENNKHECRYYYGSKIHTNDFVIVLLNKIEQYGDGMPESKTLLLVYTSDGTLTGSMPLDKTNEFYFFDSQFSTGNTQDCILSIQTIQGTVMDQKEKTGVYRGMLEYFDYSVNGQGIISCKKTKTEKVKTKYVEEPFFRAEVIEKGWSSLPSFAGIWQRQIYDPELTITVGIGKLNVVHMTPDVSFKIIDDNNKFTNLSVDKQQAMISEYGTFDFLLGLEHMEKSFTNPEQTMTSNAISYRFVGNEFLIIYNPSDEMEADYPIWEIWKRVEEGNPFSVGTEH